MKLIFGVLISVLLFVASGSNSARAITIPDPADDAPLAAVKSSRTVVLGGGCFWGIEAVFEQVKGVNQVVVGYSGGTAKTADYDTISGGKTGHAESVRITYDPSKVTFGQLLKVFFAVAHDPTELNRQGPDTGTHYRSVIFYANEEQKRIATSYIKQLGQAKVFDQPIVTQVVPFRAFYMAEDYHQDYAVHHPDQPYIVINDLPKVESLRKELPDLYRVK